MNDIAEYAWYIIPGAIFLLPFIILFNNFCFIKILYLNGVILLLTSYVAGFILHAIFRVVYYKFLYGNEKIHKHLKKKLKTNNLDRHYLDKFYFLNWFSNNKFSSHYEHLRRRTFHLSSYLTIMLSIGLSVIITLILAVILFKSKDSSLFHILPWQYRFIAIFYLILLFLIFIPLIESLDKDKSDKEKFLVDKHWIR